MTDSNANAVAGDLAAWATFTRDAVHKVVVAYGALLQSAVKRRASEPRSNPRPSASPEGPRLMTGDYSRSITRQTTRHAQNTVSVVGTNKVQGPRLEFGFRGVDSLGRNYDQRAYPHFGPALDEVAPDFHSALDVILAPPGQANPTATTKTPRVT